MNLKQLIEQLEYELEPSECPRCHKPHYGYLQHNVCPDCAFSGEGRQPALDRVKLAEPKSPNDKEVSQPQD